MRDARLTLVNERPDFRKAARRPPPWSLLNVNEGSYAGPDRSVARLLGGTFYKGVWRGLHG